MNTHKTKLRQTKLAKSIKLDKFRLKPKERHNPKLLINWTDRKRIRLTLTCRLTYACTGCSGQFTGTLPLLACVEAVEGRLSVGVRA